MVKSRYLCSAPRPETWDEKAEALLKSLGGSAEKRETLLRETLEALKVMHADKQKTGPGRKSNAEHAIAFYEYVLETITESKEENNKNNEMGDEEKASESAPEAATTRPAPEIVVKRKRGRPPKNRAQPVVVANKEAEVTTMTMFSDKKTEEAAADMAAGPPSAAAAPLATTDDHSVATMDTQEFINQHNDFCEVCSTGGELLMCSTCNLVFHMQCVRPKMEESPPDNWVCAYCVMSGVKGLKQNSRMRKNAAVAVRLMARMRKSLARQRSKRKTEKKGDDDDGDDTDNSEAKKEANDSNDDDKATSATGSDDESGENGNEKKANARDDDHKQQPTPSKGEAKEAVKSPAPDSEKKAAASPGRTRGTRSTRATDLAKNDGDHSDNKQEEKKNAESEDSDPSEIPAETEKVEVTETERDETPKKKNSQKATTWDEATPGADSIGGTRRNRRVRKQATYYDPQSGAASQWQSDGANEWKRLEHDHHTSEDDEVDDDNDEEVDHQGTKEELKEGENEKIGEGDGESKGEGSDPLSPTKKASKKSTEGTPWCNFCKDDKNIPVCCFCACRVCFGKHDQSKLLLCDKCDDEYHIFCLDPPLKSVPSSQSWFCPSCVQAEKQLNSKFASRAARTPPSKSPSASVNTVGTRSSDKSGSPKSQKTKVAKIIPDVPSATATIEPTPVKRGPGRPRKIPLPEPTSVEAPRKRGRPPKIKTPPDASISPPRKRGRPRKQPSASPPDEDSASPESVVVAEKKRGPGRPPNSDKNKKGPGRPPAEKKRGPGRPPSSEKKRGPGRPPSAEKKRGPGRPPSSEKKRGPGRPPKNAVRGRSRSPAPKKFKSGEKLSETKPRSKSSGKEDNVKTPVSAPPPVKISRSGRAVKRTSFHDEIDEGEQHLKSSRYAEMQRKAAAAEAREEEQEIEEEEDGEEAEEEGDYEEEAEEEDGDEHGTGAEDAATYVVGGFVETAGGVVGHVDHFYGVVDPHHHVDHDVDPHFLENMPDMVDMQHHLGVTLDDNFMHDDAIAADVGIAHHHVMVEPMHIHMENLHMEPKIPEPELANHVAPETNVSTEPHQLEDTKPSPVADCLPASIVNPGTHETATPPSAAASAPAPECANPVNPPHEQVLAGSPAPPQDPVIHPAAQVEAPAAPLVHPPSPALDGHASNAAPAPVAAAPVAVTMTTLQVPPTAPTQEPAPTPAPKPASTRVDPPASARIPAPVPASIPMPKPAPPPAPMVASAPAQNMDRKMAAVPAKSTITAVSPPAVAQTPAASMPSAMTEATAAAPSVAATSAPHEGSCKPAPISSLSTESKQGQPAKVPRRKPGARECMQISRRFGVNVIPDKWMDTLLDYCKRGKVEHLIRMRERLDEHSRFLESQLAGLESLVQERGELDVVVPPMPEAENEGGD